MLRLLLIRTKPIISITSLAAEHLEAFFLFSVSVLFAHNFVSSLSINIDKVEVVKSLGGLRAPGEIFAIAFKAHYGAIDF